MVPGLTERERLAADVQRLEWLCEARFGPAPRGAATSQAPRGFSPLSCGRRALTAALLLGQRVRPRSSQETPTLAELAPATTH